MERGAVNILQAVACRSRHQRSSSIRSASGHSPRSTSASVPTVVSLNYTSSNYRVEVENLPEVLLLLEDQIFDTIQLVDVYRCPAVEIPAKLPRLQEILLDDDTIIASKPEIAISLPRKMRRSKKTKHGARAASHWSEKEARNSQEECERRLRPPSSSTHQQVSREAKHRT